MTTAAPEQDITVDEAPDLDPLAGKPAIAEDLTQAPATDAPSPAPVVEVRPETVVAATYEVLMGKARRTDEFTVDLPQEDGSTVAAQFKAAAIDGPAYDKLVEKHRPDREQAARGLTWNPETFEAALMAEVVTQPKLEPAQWSKIRKSEQWSGGEWASLFFRINSLCMQGLDVSFTGTD